MVCRVYSIVSNYSWLLWCLVKNSVRLCLQSFTTTFTSTFTVRANIYRSKNLYTCLLLGCADRYIFLCCCWQLSCVIEYFGYVRQVPGADVP
jgi:hypothetical protein